MGTGSDKLVDIIAGKGDGTYIGYTDHHMMKSKKQWIGIHSEIAGKITIDPGAETAVIHKGKSLLPAGITAVEGNFSTGDVIEVINQKGELIGKGQVSYSSSELELIKGLSSEEAKKQTNKERSEVIHRNLWVTIKEKMIK